MLSMRSHAPGVSINSTADWAEPSWMYRWTRVKHVCERCVLSLRWWPHYRVAMDVRGNEMDKLDTALVILLVNARCSKFLNWSQHPVIINLIYQYFEIEHILV